MEMQKVSPYLWLTAIIGTIIVLIETIVVIEDIFNIKFFQIQNIENLLQNATEVKDVEENYLVDEMFSKAKKYNMFEDKDFNAILEFKDKGISVYKFVVETDSSIGNDGSYFNYEIGRIYLNPKNSDKSKCTYNYMAKFSNKPVKYFECTESDFIKNLPKISELKKEKYEQFKKVNEEERLFDICGYVANENSPDCAFLKDKNLEKEWERIENSRTKTLDDLRSVTLET